jgi:hypothetical protein
MHIWKYHSEIPLYNIYINKKEKILACAYWVEGEMMLSMEVNGVKGWFSVKDKAS